MMQRGDVCFCVAAVADVSFSARVFFLAIICQFLSSIDSASCPTTTTTTREHRQDDEPSARPKSRLKTKQPQFIC
jgi:hypothetical protein